MCHDFARKWMQGHYICMWKLWNKRYFATRRNKTLPCIWKSSQWPLLHAWTLAEQTFMARNVGFLVRQGSIPLKEGFQILRCWKCLKHGSNFQQFQGSTREVCHFVLLHPILQLGSCSSAAPDTVRQLRTPKRWLMEGPFRRFLWKDLLQLNIAGDALETKDT